MTLFVALLGFSGGCIESESEETGEINTLTSGDLLRAWSADTGNLSTELIGDEKVLAWRFVYNKEPAVLKQAGSATWKAMQHLSFSVKSDRAGPLFVRIDQSDRNIFLASFPTSNEWSQVSLATESFTPFGSTKGTLTLSKIVAIYLVDLAGKDNEATGGRTIRIGKMKVSGEVNLRSEGEGQVRIPLVAFDGNGNLLSEDELTDRGTSAGQWCYVSDGSGTSLPAILSSDNVVVDGKKVRVPSLIIARTPGATLEVLFWPVGKEFKVWLQADGQGKGIQHTIGNGYLLLNLELAKTRLTNLRRYLWDSLPEVVKEFEKEISTIEKDLASATTQTSARMQAARADNALERLLKISRNLVRRQSEAMIASQTAPAEEVLIPVPPLIKFGDGERVTVGFLEPDFRIGVSQSFGFIFHKTDSVRISKYYAELRNAGFNQFILPLFWDRLIDDSGGLRDQEWDRQLAFDSLVAHKYTMLAHSMIQFSLPRFLKKSSKKQFTAAAMSHLDRTVRDYNTRYGSAITLWEVINEPSSNGFVRLNQKERVELTASLIRQLRTSLPGANVMVNDYDWERGRDSTIPWNERNAVSTISFYRELMRMTETPDVLGLEWYHGARVDRPEFRVDMTEPCMDLLDTNRYWDRIIALGRPLIITEFNVPGIMAQSDKNGYAWGPWNQMSQAEAALDIFMLALSKPDVIGWTWWSITDAEPWNREGGLFTASGQPKPVLHNLTGAFKGLKRPVEVVMAADGRLRLPRMPGIYRITTSRGQSWEIKRSRSGKVNLVSGRNTGLQ